MRSIRTRTLYKDKEELEALQLGAVQMLAPSTGEVRPARRQGIRGVRPALHAPERGGAARVTDGPIGQRLFKKLEPKGIDGLAYWDNGFKIMSANKPLRMPADFKGLKFRIQSSKVLEAQFRALGAIPQVMAFSEVYQALQTGVVDGQENTPSNIYTQKFHEVQKYTTLTNHGYIGYAVDREQEVLGRPAGRRSRAARQGDDGGDRYANEISQTGERGGAGRDQEVGQDRAHRPDARQKRRRWQKAWSRSMTDMASRVGKELIDDVRKAAQGATN